MEIWKEIKDYEGLYWVSNQGRIKNKHNHILKPEYSNKGYACVQCVYKFYPCVCVFSSPSLFTFGQEIF